MGELQLSLRRYGLTTVRRLPLLLWSLWIVFLVELLSRGQWLDTFGWTFEAIPELILNTLVVLGLLLLLTAFTGSVRLSFWLVAAVCITFGLISGIKLEILGVPFLPWDLLLTSETKDMTPYLRGLLSFTVISGFVLFVAISILLLYKVARNDLQLGLRHRIGMGLVSALLLISIYNDGAFSLKKLANIDNIAWDQTINVKTNGFLLSTVMNIKFLYLQEPKGYDEQSIRAMASGASPAVAEADEVKPNIIVVLSESFWDATQVEGLKFSKDPLPFYHSLVEKYTSGTMLSPQFGGGTANVEFEVLTGNSMRFLPQGSIPYNQYIHKQTDSLASILKRQGYETTAINPFHSWFYNSKSVYEHFGFSKYISQEFFEPDYEGPYIADRAVAKYIIQASEETAGPDFIFANTMENHYHYYPGKFKENTIEVSGVSDESKGLFETYAQGLLGADDMLKRLVTHYEQKGEPTIIVFFGDHLPSLGENYKAYKDCGYLQENDPNFLDKMYRVPVLVWNNYLPEQKESLNMSPSFLGPYVLKLAQRTGTYYTDYLYEFAQHTPVIPPKHYYQQMGINEDILKGYEKLQYDILFGKQYGYADWNDTIQDPAFVLGFGALHIDNVHIEQSGEEQVVRITGKDLPHSSIVYINDEPVKTQWTDNNELTAIVEPETAGAFPWKMEIVVEDSKGHVVVKSNPYIQNPLTATDYH
ncbi:MULTISPECIES: LTA synthase family protein [unclassified Paenibacillus]|uniref:LTA synthase family protein n=1 Tax=unclassified Paenibacillus TaxID=185978 RepID=UPI001AE10C87|nr:MULTISPECIES: LTA synthase family protein [unclassified Paenibacillus]MBP1156409.1 phosphoglycerol transferase MdoB-like AlkP superfamily enzyme [Paenibacillus sp. PvP091]MBP1168205.1 phosphoglycerol transferase MdoB-like AlkP superfamily enzyme [Paenibacillus sp. PvR098]MBP2439233.1 phosphoglycerol transferase MdoB-like AlkP superfamily enzyme [Paenibacillus sp. PvP052]